MSNLDLGIIGNCCFAALVDREARIVWACLPRFDGDPIFNNLLNNDDGFEDDGFFAIDMEGLKKTEQRYLRNTAILRTVLEDERGGVMEVVDFAPRFRQYDRMFRPTVITRVVRPLADTPRIRIRIRPTFNYGADQPQITRGSNHVRYVGPDATYRLTTNATISFVTEEMWFLLDQPLVLIFGPDESLTQSVGETGRQFFDMTNYYWQDWSRSLSVPLEWQDAVIRAAITLKLCTFEETGGIVAAVTTSVPESANSARNWDYRYCWLRDAYFVVHALNRLSATRTLEHFIRFITNATAGGKGTALQPLYSLSTSEQLEEYMVDSLPGYRGMGPVRSGNQAYEQVQNDVFGAVILAVTQSFFDQRLSTMGDEALYRRLSEIGERAVTSYDQPDAGIWEFRTIAEVHTFSAVMCWAAADRLARIAAKLGLEDEAARWKEHAEQMHARIATDAWNVGLNSFVSTFGGDRLDASLLLIKELGFVAADDPRFVGTVEAVEKHLKNGNHLYRYQYEDDFGKPETAFTVCTFWFIEALADIGRADEARALFEHVLACRNHLGLLSEDIDPDTGELWGNFPQTYSMVGLVKCAMRLSKGWEDAF
jgi:GH15 family glucan-1,4-alpha-glucosidase